MSSKPTESKLIKNEQILRDKNLAAAKDIKKAFQNDEEVKNAPISFVCECSKLDCNEHVNISIKDYEKQHQKKNRFTLFEDHSTPSIEKVVKKKNDIEIVEKFALSEQ